MPESVKRRGSSGPTIGATERSVASWRSLSSTAMVLRLRRRRTSARSLRAMDALRALPSVDRLAAELDAAHPLAVIAARAVIDERRAELRAGASGDVDLLARARARVARIERRSPRRVLNATGVIVHTNLGRAPLARAAQAAVARVAQGYSDLEWDAERGERGSRHDHVAGLLCELTGAEAAMAVNNCAAAVLLAAAALAGPDRIQPTSSAGTGEVIVSRGQLVE